MKIETKQKTRLISWLLALLMVVSVFPHLPSENVQAGTAVTTSHDRAGYSIYESGGLYTGSYLDTPMTPGMIADFTAIFSGYNLVTATGAHTEFYSRTIGNFGTAVCANPLFLSGASYSDRINISTAVLDSANLTTFLSKYASYRYPAEASKFGVTDSDLARGAKYTYFAGVFEKGVSQAVYQKLVEEVKKDQNRDVKITLAELQSAVFRNHISWLYSPDYYLADKHGVSFRLAQNVDWEKVKDFYQMVVQMEKMMKEGTLTIH